MKQIQTPRIAVMRHAEYQGEGDRAVLTQPSIHFAIETAKVMAKNILDLGFTKVKFYCSTELRAALTVNAMRRTFPETGITLLEMERCRSLRPQTGTLNESFLSSTVDYEDEDVFVVLMTHAPNISTLLCCAEGLIDFCAVYAKDFRIQGHP